MKITMRSQTPQREAELGEYLRNKFSKIQVGKVIRIKAKWDGSAQESDYTYLMLGLGPSPHQTTAHKTPDKASTSQGVHKPTTVVEVYYLIDLGTGYLWRIGEPSLKASFNLWFAPEGNLNIWELDIAQDSEIVLGGFQ